jgi:hypothetical protein
MLTVNSHTETTTADEVREPIVGPTCPCCAGVLLPQRGTWQCVRCRFTTCEGCDGDPMPTCPATPGR